MAEGAPPVARRRRAMRAAPGAGRAREPGAPGAVASDVADLRRPDAGPAPPRLAQGEPVYLNSRIAPGFSSAVVAPPVGPLVFPAVSVMM